MEPSDAKPLSTTFTLASILGLMLFAVLTFFGKIDVTWGLTFIIFFTICFLAAFTSITPDFPEKHKVPAKNPAKKKFGN